MFFDEINFNDFEMVKKKKNFFFSYIFYVIVFLEDFEIVCEFFKVIYVGIKVLFQSEFLVNDQVVWEKVVKYLEVWVQDVFFWQSF